MTHQDTDQTVTIQEAAIALGISVEAVRKRLQRGTLRGVRDGRTWRVYLPKRPDTGQTEDSERIQDLKDQIAFLRQELERKDHIIAGFVQRLPELPQGLEQDYNIILKPRRRWWPWRR